MLLGAVLVGGASRRMGRPKALLNIDGQPLAARVGASIAAAGATRVVAIGGELDWQDSVGLDVVPDRWPGIGPLGGIATALQWAAESDPASLVIVVACDQPNVLPDTIKALATGLTSASPEVGAIALVTHDGYLHPFPSVWRATSVSILEDLVAAGERRAATGFVAVGGSQITGQAAEVADLDTPADLTQWHIDNSQR